MHHSVLKCKKCDFICIKYNTLQIHCTLYTPLKLLMSVQSVTLPLFQTPLTDMVCHNDKPFICQYCPKRYIESHHLDNHVSSDHGPGYTAYQPYILYKHYLYKEIM